MDNSKVASPPLTAPFPWFGGKRRVAHIVWDYFGNTQNYVEPFFGSGAVLLGRPHKPTLETVNDLDCMVVNFWRAVAAEPDAVAHHADWPTLESDMHARKSYLKRRRDKFQSEIEGDPEFYDARVAGWWAWALSISIGSGATGRGPWVVKNGRLVKDKTNENNSTGITRSIPILGISGEGVASKQNIYSWMAALSTRMRRVRVCCGDWKRVLGCGITTACSRAAVFLDPPYIDDGKRTMDVYAKDSKDIAGDVEQWCRENGDNPLLRIALCGYDGQYDMPSSWSVVRWKATGGYGNQGNGRGRENACRERIWFSAACHKEQMLF